MNDQIITDLNGTLRRGSVGINFANAILEDEDADEINQILLDTKKGDMSRREGAEKVYEVYANSVEGRSREDVEEEARKFIGELDWSESPRNPFKGVEGQIHVISDNPEPVVEAYLDGLETPEEQTEAHGMTMESEDGIYTGKIEHNMVKDGKETVVGKVVEEENEVIAIGDTIMDKDMFEAADYAILVAPSDNLIDLAEDHDWTYQVCEGPSGVNQAIREYQNNESTAV